MFHSRSLLAMALVPAALLGTDLTTVNAAPDAAPTPVMTDITQGLKIVEEIDTAEVAPVWESKPGVSQVVELLGKKSRTIPNGENAAAIAYILGKDKPVTPGKAYILSVEYPDDLPRSAFVANRGADMYRGWSTGTAVGDSREQYTEMSPESLNYPQTGKWQEHKQFFYLLERFQGISAVRNLTPEYRPHTPKDGFHVILFQPKKLSDPRSNGAAFGKIRLYEVEDPSKLYAPIHYPPADLPKRRIFWREEMADQVIQGIPDKPESFAVESVEWYVQKMRMAKILGINTFTKDLLEFGFNQGWETGDEEWTLNAQPPNKDLWQRLVPAATKEGMDVLPYYEWKTAIGAGKSLAKQRRAEKLYHEIKKVCGYGNCYTCVYWTEAHNGDITDPDSLADAKRMLDITVVKLKEQGHFAGVWFRVRATHLPMSFAQAALDRFKKDNPNLPEAQNISRQTMIASYEGDKALYDKYVAWWFVKRADFFSAIQKYLAEELKQPDLQVLYTPFTGEAVPTLHAPDNPYGYTGVLTDDPDWWTNYAKSLDGGYWTYHWMPVPFEKPIAEKWYEQVLSERQPIDHPHNSGGAEAFHSAPTADPLNYKNRKAALTYPIGRLFTVANPEALEKFRAGSGLTVVKHYTLNEDHQTADGQPSPFGTNVGYISVDVDRAGNHLMLQQARAVANGDPRNIAYLSGSSFSTGFPEVMRRFNQAFLAVPALPSERLDGASSDPEVVVRKISTKGKGTYYFVVNTSMQRKEGVKVTLPTAEKEVKNLVTNSKAADGAISLDSGELHAYWTAK